MTPPLADREARERIRQDLDTTLVVEAAAGTGKTSELVRRVVAALMAGRARLDSIVAVTFTEAAAGELKLRLRTAIERARQSPETPPDARARLDAALPQLEEARIGTIHSFCADLLRERPVEARVDPLFEVAPDDVVGPIFDRAFDRWFEAQLAAPGDAVRRLLRRRTREEGPRRRLRDAAWDLAERRDFPTAWRHDPPFERDAAIDRVMDAIAELAAWAAAGDADDYFTRSLVEIRSFLEETQHREAVRGRDYDGLEAALCELLPRAHWNWRGYRRGSPTFPKPELIERRDALRAQLQAFREASGADIAPRLRDELWPVVETYERLKERAGCLDFLDLLLRARDLVRGSAAVRRELQGRFTHIFVDEFQDTDPLQAEILFLLASDDPDSNEWRSVRAAPGKLFLVADPKQSIYRFRRADVALYEQVKRQLVAGGAAVVNLTVSFRAVPEIQEAVNAAFEPRMRGATPGEPTYVPLAPFRAAPAAQPAIVALPVPEPYGSYNKIVQWRIDESLPDAVAAFVAWLVQSSGWTVTERDRPAERVRLEPRHIAILTSTNSQAVHVQDALRARRVPSVLYSSANIFGSHEARELRDVLAAVAQPTYEKFVRAALCTDALGRTGNDLDSFTRDDRAWEIEVLRFQKHHQTWRERGFIQMLRQLSAEHGVRRRLLSYPDGERRLTNFLHLAELLH
jgi:ATP-dependent exoDNAse (exonuclease V) beta subunit